MTIRVFFFSVLTLHAFFFPRERYTLFFVLSLDKFFRKREIRFRAFAPYVVQHYRHSVARRFRKADIARNNRVIHALAKVLSYFFRNLFAYYRAVVVHGKHHAFHFKRGVKVFYDQPYRIHKLA